MAQQRFYTTHRGEGGTTFAFKYADGTMLSGDVLDLATSLFNRAAVHGVIQRIADAGAKGRDDKTGQSVPLAVKVEAMKAVYRRLFVDGVWSMDREGGVRLDATLVTAIARAYRMSEKKAREFLAGKPADQRQKYLTVARVKVEYDAILAEGVDVDDLDAELEEIGEGDSEGEGE